jgi:GT2 family glycosyltransferase
MEESPATPKVSVLVTSYNCAASLRRCLAALEKSGSRDTMEILVVDLGSQDESPGLDAEFPGATFLRLPRNFGLTKARNIGVRTATGEFVLFLHQDVEVSPETVSLLAARLEADPEVIAVGPLLMDPEGHPSSVIRRLPSEETLAKAWRGYDPPGVPFDLKAEAVPVERPPDTALLVRRQFVRGMNYFDERYGYYWADAELCLQVRRAARKILLLPQVRAVYHAGDSALPEDPNTRALLVSDCALGAAGYISKHQGWLAGLRFRVSSVLAAFGRALWSLVRFQDVSFHFNVFRYLLSGQKIDGSQRGL